MQARISTILHKNWFFHPEYTSTNVLAVKYKEAAEPILIKCSKLRSAMPYQDIRDQLKQISNLVQTILNDIATLDKKPEDTELNQLLTNCRTLQAYAFDLPSKSPAKNDSASFYYKVAMVCLYLLAFSFGVALGATFGAWYFGYLTSSYFVDSLATAVAVFGIPATGLGIISYAFHKIESNAEDDCSTIVDDISSFCDLVVSDFSLAGPVPETPECK